jgi:beta-galactosidase
MVMRLSVLFLLFIGTFATAQQNPPRKILDFNSGWQFKKQEPNADWQSVQIPHSTNIEPLVVNNQWQGISEYKKIFRISADQVANKRVFLEFEGVMQESKVFLNEKFLQGNEGGYLPFVIDITDNLKIGDTNELWVVVTNTDNPVIPPGKPLKDLDFNTYGGIYRNVNLIITPEIYITNAEEIGKTGGGGLLVHFDHISKLSAQGMVRVHLQHQAKKPADILVVGKLTDSNGSEVRAVRMVKKFKPGSDTYIDLIFDVQNPRLWSPGEPNLYDLTVEVLVNNVLTDQVRERVGIRKIEVKPEGFFLNDEKTFLWGTNRHQEYPYVGYAIGDRADWRDAVKIKNAGFDLVRLSHYPHSRAFLEACDELGIIVMDAIPGWQWFLNDHQFLMNSHEDISTMVRRDRNHPSVMFWEVSLNESEMTEEYMVKANQILKEELPFSDTYSAGWLDHPSYHIFIPARQHGQAPDYWNDYRTTERPIFIAEYGDWEYYAQNAGFNQKAFQDLKEDERTSRQLRGFGEKRLLQQALNYQEAANSNLKGPNTFGHANWLMFDYNRGYANDLESSGISDIFRLPKFAYWFYQSQRAPIALPHPSVKSGPMVKVATWWTNSSSPEIKVFSNCDEVALFLNGNLVERKRATRDILSDQLPYPPFVFHTTQFKPGELKAVGYINNESVAEDVVKSPDRTVAIKMDMDLSGIPLNPSGQDMVFVYARLTDDLGTTIPSNEVEVYFTLSGDAELIGENPIKSEAGIATILLRTNGKLDNIVITAMADGYADGKLHVDEYR